MAIAELDAHAGASESTLTYSVSTGENRALFALTGSINVNADDADSVTYGGQSMTALYVVSSSSQTKGTIWWLNEAGIAASTGTALIASGHSGSDYIAAGSYTGAAQTSGNLVANQTKYSTQVGSADTGQQGNIIAGSSGGYVIGVGVHRTVSDAHTWDAVTQQQKSAIAGGSFSGHGFFLDLALSSTGNTDVDWSAGTAFSYVDGFITVNKATALAALSGYWGVRVAAPQP